MLQKFVNAARSKARFLVLALLGGLFALIPGSAHAEEAVALHFTQGDKNFLYASLGFGLVAVIFAYLIGQSVLAQSCGSEKMQEVGAAIRAGAMAYLQRQIKTMSFFIGALAILLAWFFSSKGWDVGIYLAICFVGGVFASYIAGFAGMIMAVGANMRSAAAALESPKRSLEVAFRAGAVAGLLTVGMGLIGATTIFLFAGNGAMQLLIGFGFGGSLAALFMRVGGGIYTKAADVGADLVGKVEAGIPEDDPRNAATIADNVGDNVGDCAGMAADVFESYEVTLVAAIVLGAATHVIFDQSTWMRLVIFALMARGVGIIASIIGILMVRGSEDVDSNALTPIRRGFMWSAVFASIGTAALAFLMMGGIGGAEKVIHTSRVVSLEQLRKENFDNLRKVQEELAAQQSADEHKTIEPWMVPVAKVQDEMKKRDTALRNDVRKLMAAEKKVAADSISEAEVNQDPRFYSKAYAMDDPAAASMLRAALMPPPPNQPKPLDLAGYAKVDLSKTSKSPVLDYAINKPSEVMGQPATLVKLKEYFVDPKDDAKKALYTFHIHYKTKPASAPGQPPQESREDEVWIGPMDQETFDKQMKQVATMGTVEVKNLGQEPVNLYANAAGDLALGLSDKIIAPERKLMGGGVPPYYKMSVEQAQKLVDANKADFNAPAPPDNQIAMGLERTAEVPWYLFFLAIFFGIAMAFAIEKLTDYYVSLHGRPVQEVAGVSSAGPAPMIINGFALGLESSVFSVFSIVVALLVPLYLFSPGVFGSPILSFYGIALVGLGLLTTTGYILAMDTFGPISDNAQGVFEMSGAGHDNPVGAKAVQRLDAAGNTTKALTKGFAIATAVVAAVALFHSYIESAQLTTLGLKLEVPEIFLGLLIGGAAPFLFSAFAINAVGRASFELINEVRRQFKSDPGIMKGTSKPDYGRCVAIVTEAAQRELLGPGILAIALPMAVAFGFSIGKPLTNIGGVEYNLAGAQALGGFLAGAILSGQLMAVLLANSGGIWDNAKKLIEDGMYGGKGSDAHKAGVVCDTVGDPFKDTAGPALNPLIKVMNLVALLLVPIIIQPRPNLWLAVITGVCLAALIFSIWWSKRSSMSTAMSAVGGGDVEAPPVLESASSKKRLTIEDEQPEPEKEES